jgi:hypothetical protein
LCGFARTLRQTRSGTRDTHALGHDLPRIRAFFGSLVCCPQARLRTFPVLSILGTRGQNIWESEMGSQKRGIEVSLHRPHATGALMPTLRERLFRRLTTAMTKLGEFGGERRNFVQGAARARPRCASTGP